MTEESQIADSVLEHLAEVVAHPGDLEGFVRPLLQLLETVSGLESTYFTRVDDEADAQQVVFARNVGSLAIPEGLQVQGRSPMTRRYSAPRNFATMGLQSPTG